jgi:glucose/arabinose dehydrogenase
LSALAASPLPPCAPGWKVEVVVQAPDLVFPSVVCCAPDGRIFVGEDPVDMTSPAASAADKVLCIFPNGKITTFATNLHAVFGLQYIDGKLFVHNSPQFSVFDDCNGFGSNRVDLIKSDNPHPWLPSFNDHIPSNCRLAMDGYLYVSTGDKGVFGAVGTDGRKLEMHGGGVYRMRPNGAELEVYSTGTRNHLDVAINSEDEMFTYDNTDDGCGWWSRMTHMVDGGYYGYPYDYKPQRPYTLWMMVDYGAGAATGACAYDEDALPAEFHGNLFVCDWSRAQVMRLIVERSGASYKVVRRVQTGKLDIMNRSAAETIFIQWAFASLPMAKGFT